MGRKPADGKAHRELMAQRRRDYTTTARDIGELPKAKYLRQKKRAAIDFRFFCEFYHRESFGLSWSRDHLEAIDRIEQAVLHGALFALAMPRGSGKTTLAETACEWAALYGHRKFIVLIGSDAGGAERMLDSIRVELETNERLAESFPEAVFPILALERIAQRARGQTYRGKPTHISWKGETLIMPTIPKSPASGAVIRSAGMTASIRGMKQKTADGQNIRPDLVVIDDPQTDESARSPTQCADRESILSGAILGLAGPGKKIAGIMPCTVIQEGDLADRMLDRQKHPEWQGRRTAMVVSMPTNLTKEDAKKSGAKVSWEDYQRVRIEGLQAEKGLVPATKFYRQHRRDLDAGAEVSWPDRHNEDEASAIQSAMNLYFLDEYAFWAEYQNQPKPREQNETKVTVDCILARGNGHARRLVPAWAHTLTAMIDVQGEALFWTVCAWGDGLTGSVIDYGVWPEQARRHFNLQGIKRTITKETGVADLEGRLYKALGACTKAIVGQEYQGDDGGTHTVSRCLVDANWGQSTNVVYQFCRQSPFAAALTPSHGRGITASTQPLNAAKKQKGERTGHYWRMPPAKGQRGRVRYVLFDANFWKTWTHDALATPIGQSGALTLYDGDRRHHLLLAEHLTAEYSVRTQGRGREVDEWKPRPGKPDNHWFDTLVGCAVAASMEGLSPGKWAPKTTAPRQARRKRSSEAKRETPTPQQKQAARDRSGGFMAGFGGGLGGGW